MNVRHLFKPDWQTFVIVVAVVAILGDVAHSIFGHPSAADPDSDPLTPPVVVQRSEEVIERLGNAADANGGITRMPASVANDPSAVTVPRRPLTPEKAREAALQSLQHFDYETLHAMQTRILDEARVRVREQGVGPDGVTASDIERMQKNGQMPQ